MGSELIPFGGERASDFQTLVGRLGEVFRLGQQQIEEIKIRSYWEAGRLIHRHILKHEKRAGYGKQVIRKLAEALELGENLLYRMLRFYQAFPILATWPELTWSHYRLLSQVTDAKERHELGAQAAAQKWTARELEDRIRESASTAARTISADTGDNSGTKIRLLEPTQGKIGIYKIVETHDGLAVDLGFTSYEDLDPRQVKERQADELVTFSASGRMLPAKHATQNDLYTHQARCLRVVDGDTFWAQIWLTERLWLKEKVRLRGLDSPELDTAEGRAAKRVVEMQFKKAANVLITKTKPDKWDR